MPSPESTPVPVSSLPNLADVPWQGLFRDTPLAADDGSPESQQARRQVCFFLDYDGTLTPIVPDPERAYLPPETRDVLARLSQNYPTAVISGRAKHKIQSFVDLPTLFIAGSHGFDIVSPQSHSNTRLRKGKSGADDFSVATSYRPMLVAILQMLAEKVVPYFPGCELEDNFLSLSVHYRKVDKTFWQEVETRFDAVLGDYQGLRKTKGKCVLEIRPDVAWDKGKAVEYLATQIREAFAQNEPGKRDANGIFPIYIGDDKTDEDAFAAVSRLHGLAIIVADDHEADLDGRVTLANFRVRDVSGVRDFLKVFAFNPTEAR